MGVPLFFTSPALFCLWGCIIAELGNSIPVAGAFPEDLKNTCSAEVSSCEERRGGGKMSESPDVHMDSQVEEDSQNTVVMADDSQPEQKQEENETQQEASQQEASQQDASQQDASQQEESQQEASQQEESQQEAHQQEAHQQEASQQQVMQQEASQQQVMQQDASQQEAHQQEESQQEAHQQEAHQQEASQQQAMQQEESQQQGDKEKADEKEKKAKKSFPTTLEGFGYEFNDEGQLRNTVTGEPFVFEVKKGDKAYNQAHYEAMGEVLTEVVYQLLETTAGLMKTIVPIDHKGKEPLSFIFMSGDALTNRERLMILIHGSGVVRAGQWARRLIMNDCLDSGTQLPFIRRAMSEGYGVMVLNTNRNYDVIDGKKLPIRGSSSPQEHARYVWTHFVKKAKAKRIDIVAHSFGGVVTVDLAAHQFDDFKKRVHKIAFTDSVHDMDSRRTPKSVRNWMIEHAVNWVSSPDPLDASQPAFRKDVKRVSAGSFSYPDPQEERETESRILCLSFPDSQEEREIESRILCLSFFLGVWATCTCTKKHEETSWYSFNSIFGYFHT